jgi:peptidoglycan-N-acetylglucosamine deacetylase
MKIVFTTSWDDGHHSDKRLSDLLNRYGVRGTFYVARDTIDRLSEEEIKILSNQQEVGAHTLTHRNLSELDINEVGKEIGGSKKWLEELIAQPVKMFCYPRGNYNDQVKESVQVAGFIGARTVKPAIGPGADNFALPVTLQVYPFPWRMKDDKHLHLSRHLFEPMFGNFGQIKNLSLPISSWKNWNALAENILMSPQNGGYFHLWGHSWEIDKYNFWKKLENFLQFVVRQKDIIFLTNSEVVEYYENLDS